jgi:NADH-quinone oxidoreductase subunit B
VAEGRLKTLHVGEEREEGGALLTTVDSVINWARKNSLWPMPMGLSCCAIEFMAAAASRFDISRFGAEVARFSPKQADVMIVAGTMTYKMGEAVRRLYDQMAEPKWVIAMGACASSAGMFRTYPVMQGIDHIVPVDYYIPGCPPRPEMLLNALLELQKRVSEDSSFRRTNAGRLVGVGSKG